MHASISTLKRYNFFCVITGEVFLLNEASKARESKTVWWLFTRLCCKITCLPAQCPAQCTGMSTRHVKGKLNYRITSCCHSKTITKDSVLKLWKLLLFFYSFVVISVITALSMFLGNNFSNDWSTTFKHCTRIKWHLHRNKMKVEDHRLSVTSWMLCVARFLAKKKTCLCLK